MSTTGAAALLADVDILARRMATTAAHGGDWTEGYRLLFEALREVADMLGVPLGLVLDEVAQIEGATARIRQAVLTADAAARQEAAR